MDSSDFWEFIEEHFEHPDEITTKMKEEKVGPDIVAVMSEEALSKYIAHHGDRVRIRNFLREKGNKVKKKEKKSKLLAVLKEKLEGRKKKREVTQLASSDEDLEMKSAKRNVGNRNAEKITRKIKLGWIHKTKLNRIQVREKRGGGTRLLDIKKDATKEDIIEEAKKLFFPGGHSPKGPLTSFDCDLWDFSEGKVAPGKTLGEMYSAMKLPVLRFYFATSEKNDVEDTAVAISENDGLSDTDSLPDLHVEIYNSGTPDTGILTPAQKSDDNVPVKHLAAFPGQKPITSGNVFYSSQGEGSNDNVPMEPSPQTPQNCDGNRPAVSEQDILLQAICESGIQDDDNTVFSVDLNFLSTLDTAPHNPSSLPEVKEHNIQLHRGHILKELIRDFRHIDPRKDVVKMQIIMQNGDFEAAEDGGGVTRDALSEFWTSFYDECTVGNVSKVPTIRHDYHQEEWQSVARIICFGWRAAGYFPIQLSQVFMQQCLYNEVKGDLVTAFMSYISENDAKTLQNALTDFDSVDEEDLLDVFEPYGLKTRLRQGNLKSVVVEIAHKELIQEGMFIIDCWRSVLQSINIPEAQLNSMYSEMLPTPRRVISSLQFPDKMSAEETVVSNHLRRFIRELDKTSLKKFLRFSTGSDLLIGKIIEVAFVGVTGLARRPVAHTCSCLLELPRIYENFPQFRTEFMSVLNANIWVMDII